MPDERPASDHPPIGHVLIRTKDTTTYARGYYFGGSAWTCEGTLIQEKDIAGWLPMPVHEP